MKKKLNTNRRPFFTKESYVVYLRSQHWKKKRAEYLENDKRVVRNRKKFGKDVCISCKSPDGLNVHHKTYDNVGKEQLKDLMLLCRNCHLRVHESHKKNKTKSIHQHTYKILHTNWKNSEKGKAILEAKKLKK